MKRCALYSRVSTLDQHPETQLIELRAAAQQRGYDELQEYVDHGFSGADTKRPALAQLLSGVRHARIHVVLVAAFDRMARSVKHFLEVLEELNHLNIEFISLRENIDTGGPLGRAIVTIIGAIAELERSLIVERVRAGMRRAKLEGRKIGRPPIDVDVGQILHDRAAGMSLKQIVDEHRISRTSVRRILGAAAPKGMLKLGSQLKQVKCASWLSRPRTGSAP